jgi:hypothetical protein
MPLLLLLLLPLLLLALWLLLWPLLLWARYRNGKARRRVQGWVVRVNAWLLAASVPMFVLGAWITSHWFPDALWESAAGLGAGVVLGSLSLWLTRFEHDERGYYYTPNRWLVLALTGLLALRILLGIIVSVSRFGAPHIGALGLLDAGALGSIAGLFLGYGLAYTWGLRYVSTARGR